MNEARASSTPIPGSLNTAWHETRTVNSEAAFVIPFLTPGMSLLDCGCGPGTITLGLAKQVAPGNVVGLDLDSSRVEAAQRRAGEAEAANVRFETGNVLDLPFADESFDAVFCNMLLMHLPDSQAALGEMVRVLRPGGICALSETDHHGQICAPSDSDYDDFQEFYEYAQAARGADYYIGERLKGMVIEAGCSVLLVSAENRVFFTTEEIARWQGLSSQFLDGAEAQRLARLRYEDAESRIPRWRVALDRWSERPDSLVVQLQIQVVGRKPD